MVYIARCYCGRSRLRFEGEPLQVVYCHCDDCRRWTGAAAPVLAAFSDEAVQGLDTIGPHRSFAEGTRRWNCSDCGSPLLGQFDYVPGQSWVPLGVIDDAGTLEPTFHCYGERAHSWLPTDALPGSTGSGRTSLNDAKLTK